MGRSMNWVSCLLSLQYQESDILGAPYSTHSAQETDNMDFAGCAVIFQWLI